METTTEEKTEIITNGAFKWEKQGGIEFVCLNPDNHIVFEDDKHLLSINYAEKGKYWYYSTQVIWDKVNLKGSNYGVWEQKSHRCDCILDCWTKGSSEMSGFNAELSIQAASALQEFFLLHSKPKNTKPTTENPFKNYTKKACEEYLIKIEHAISTGKPPHMLKVWKRGRDQAKDRLEELNKPAAPPVERVLPGEYSCNVPYTNEMGYRFTEKDNLIVLAYDQVNDNCICKFAGEQQFHLKGETVRAHWRWWMLDGNCEMKDGLTFSKRYTKQEEQPFKAPVEQVVVKEVDGLQQVVMFDVPEQKQKPNPDAELHGYIAKNKGDRQRFKRKATQLIDKLNALPPLERNALIRAVNSKFTPPQILINEDEKRQM